jgi:hypothetical protein
MDRAARALGRARAGAAASRQTADGILRNVKHRDVVRGGICLYLSAQITVTACYLFSVPCKRLAEFRPSIAAPRMWCLAFPDPDIDETSMVPIVNSLVASSTSTST